MYFRTGGRDERERYQYNYLTVQRYLSMKCRKKEPRDFFFKHGLKKIAIYGVGELGKCLICDLEDSGIEIAYILDRAFETYPKGYKGIPVINPVYVNEQEEVDAIVITTLFEMNVIIDLLLEKGQELDNIINISDIVYSL